MSQAGRGKPNKVPGMRQNGGVSGPTIPPDLEYPVTICNCSGNPQHDPRCDGECGTWEPTETQVKLSNIHKEFARNGMSVIGLPEGLPVPMDHISIDLIELQMRQYTLEEIVFELVGMTRDEFDEKYRENKVEWFTNILEQNRESVKKKRTMNALGIVDGPGLLGPDGRPLGG